MIRYIQSGHGQIEAEQAVAVYVALRAPCLNRDVRHKTIVRHNVKSPSIMPINKLGQKEK